MHTTTFSRFTFSKGASHKPKRREVQFYSAEERIEVYHWHIQQKTHMHTTPTPLPWYLMNFKYYPLLSLIMLVPAFTSLILLLAFMFYDAKTIHPGILTWASVAFGGMYIVLISAAREIDEEKNKHL